nr:NADH-quinone oxidoreductase subunit L [Gammaproteobacteria bacterium]
MYQLSLMALLSPLCGALLAAVFGKSLGKWFTNSVTILGVLISLGVSTLLLSILIKDPSQVLNQSIYSWMKIGELEFQLGFLIDNLTASMMFVVTFVSLMVHIYSIGYMKDDPGYHRFFSYISLFTFSMLSLLMANNFLQLFFGWEAVGVMSYLLIGFWYTKASAIKANFKAFIINRVGDFSLLLGIALLFANLGTLDYISIFKSAESLSNTSISISSSLNVSVITLSCILLFGGAMGKSAQLPLHVWLPDSMEGPTPISA